MKDLVGLLNKSSLNKLTFHNLSTVIREFLHEITKKNLPSTKLPNYQVELRSPRKVLINIKNKDQKWFLWCHVRHNNPLKEYPERIAKDNEKLVKDLDYDGIDFRVRENHFRKIEKRSTICINVFSYEDKLVFSKYISDQKFENSMDLLFVIDGDKSHYVYIKDFDRFMFH